MKPDMRAVLDALGIDYKDRPGWAKTHCYNPDHEDRVASATVNLDEGAFTCHACGAAGDTYSLIQLRLRCDFVEAKRWAEESAGSALPAAQSTPFSGRRISTGSYTAKFRRKRVFG